MLSISMFIALRSASNPRSPLTVCQKVLRKFLNGDIWNGARGLVVIRARGFGKFCKDWEQ